MHALWTFALAFWIFWFPQFAVPGRTGAIAGSGTLSVTGHFGGTSQGDFDTGNAGVAFASPFATPSVVPTFDGIIHIFVGSHDTGQTTGVALYNDNGGKPDGGSKVCSTTVSGSTISDGWNAIAVPGCPSTLSTSTTYWITQFTGSNTQEQGHQGYDSGYCASTIGAASLSSVFVTGVSSWASTFPTGSTSVIDCYDAYVDLTYSSSAPYNIVAINVGLAMASDNPFVVNFPAFGAGHGMIVEASSVANNGVPQTVTGSDSASGTISPHSCRTTGALETLCWMSETAPATSITSASITYSYSGAHAVVVVMEVAGTNTSSSFDQLGYASSGQATPFSESTGGSTGQSVEFMVGGALDYSLGAAGSPPCYFAGTSGWTANWQGQNNESVGNESLLALFTKLSSSTGTQALTGTCVGEPNSSLLPAISTYK